MNINNSNLHEEEQHHERFGGPEPLSYHEIRMEIWAILTLF